MRLDTVRIRNFRSIKELDLSFSSNLYCLVGKNEVGKSNILRAISFLSDNPINGEIREMNRLSSNSVITGEFLVEEPERTIISKSQIPLKTSSTSYNLSAIDAVVVNGINNSKLDRSISLRMTTHDILTSKESGNLDHWNNLMHIIESLLPSIQIFEQEAFLISPFSYEHFESDPQNPSLQTFIKLFKLGGLHDLKLLKTSTIEDIVELREGVADNVNVLLRKYYKQEFSIQIKIESHNAQFTLHFKDQYSKRLNQFENRSTGFQYFFSFLINKIFDNEFGKKSSIFLLDEPALSLHPTGQKDFVKILEDVSKKNQILYTTHSPFSINRLRPSSVWVIEKDQNKGTFLNFKPFHKNWRPLRTSLGIDLSDSFFYGDRTLIVEGAEDRIYILALINYFISKRKWVILTDLISIIDAGSISNIPAMVQILLEENRSIVVLMDSDDTRVYNQIKKKQEKVKGSLLVSQISDFSKDAVSIEDLLPQEVYLFAVNKYVDYLIGEKVFVSIDAKKERPDFNDAKGAKRYTAIATTILENYTNEDKSPLDKKVPISKVGIAHEFDKLLQSNNDLDKEVDSICEKFIRQLLSALGVLESN